MGHDVTFYNRIEQHDVDVMLLDVDDRQRQVKELDAMDDSVAAGRPRLTGFTDEELFDAQRTIARNKLGMWVEMGFDFGGHNTCGRIYKTIAPAGFDGYNWFLLKSGDEELIRAGINTLRDENAYGNSYIIEAYEAALEVIRKGGEVKVVAD